MKPVTQYGIEVCGNCKGALDVYYEWLGENSAGVGCTEHLSICKDCGASFKEIVEGG